MKHLNNNHGSAVPLILAITFLLLCLVGALFQNYAVIAAADTIHSSMEKVALTAVARQTETTYSSKRESWHGAYQTQTDGSDWQESIQFMDGISQLNGMLHFQRDGDILTKYNSNGSMLCRLSNIVVLVDNPALKQDRTIQATVSLTFEMPLRFGSIHKTISVPMSVTAENKPKF